MHRALVALKVVMESVGIETGESVRFIHGQGNGGDSVRCRNSYRASVVGECTDRRGCVASRSGWGVAVIYVEKTLA